MLAGGGVGLVVWVARAASVIRVGAVVAAGDSRRAASGCTRRAGSDRAARVAPG
jgi:hypothetical protein